MIVNKVETFSQFLSSQVVYIEPVVFCVNILLSSLFAYILSKVYVKYGNALSNRVAFSRNFLLITMTTMLVISIVKSSLALSLGLVGALSIVRFRTAIKDPEELSYVFFTIAIGLGFGANQRLITILGFALVVSIIVLRDFRQRKNHDYNLVMTINTCSTTALSITDIVKALKAHFGRVELKHHGEKAGGVDSSFIIECQDSDKMDSIQKELKEKDVNMTIQYFSLNS